MELSITKTYTIKVDDNNNNKCSKDCRYYLYKGAWCSLLCHTSSGVNYEKLKDDNRTEYCKKFVENKEFEK
ncbi:hypothetical protein [Brachyspira pilosicoli]|uniref:hypothetical protein n=1 Tax=Brachyspira pilosicoli TaxID=52584 RepID=UPI000E11A126|nr:hypothetical protein [Brachyspira pilosicoli]SUW01007.1 Uncharacterised protein [Brachyspira pilosicoli]SUW05080.1 Uncharacterised protein [Brachyspira pilosicoli]SUW06209.1 Uncharacterised protein [Brachyspira pilosicoli]SUW09065.1 Uncharacterised protein [Brachyspira pilosicoli]